MNVTDYTKDNKTTFIRPEDWVKVKAPELFSFEKIGDKLMGTLLDMRTEKIDGRDVLTCRMEMGDGTQAKFRPSFDLRQKLGKRLLGKRLLIVYDYDQDTGKENGLKMFRVFVAPDDHSDPPFVPSDADLPETL